MTTDLSSNSYKKYTCELCSYSTSFVKDYNKHLDTQKHKNNKNNKVDNVTAPKTRQYTCKICSKIFNDRAGLWRHSKKCNNCPTEIMQTDKDLIMMLIKTNIEITKEHNEFKNMMLEFMKNGTHNTTTTNINSNNKAFNLNFFLNETCKDAMNINDFVNSIKLQVEDLERIGELGYVEGISSIITNNLKALDITKRPVHCTDKKREIIYVKEDNKWTKDENKTHIRNAIKTISNKNIKLLPQFRAKYPEHNNAYSKQSDLYDKMIIEVMSTEVEKEDKIIRNISKLISIDK